MERLTKRDDNGNYFVSVEQVSCEEVKCKGSAIEKLAAYENMQETLEKQYHEVTGKLEKLKVSGKIKTSTAQQLLAQKLTYSSMLGLMDIHSGDEG